MGFGVWRRIVARLTLAAIALHGGAGTAQASADDFMFKSCLQTLALDPDVLRGQVWHNSPLDPKLEHAETAQLYGAKIARWTDHKNADGSRTIVIMVRDTLPQLSMTRMGSTCLWKLREI